MHGATDAASADERDAFLARECAGDDALRRAVDALLKDEAPDTGELGGAVEVLAAEIASPESDARQTDSRSGDARRLDIRSSSAGTRMAIVAVAGAGALAFAIALAPSILDSWTSPHADENVGEATPKRPDANRNPANVAAPTQPDLAGALNRVARVFLDLGDPTTATIVLRASLRGASEPTIARDPRFRTEAREWATRARAAVAAHDTLEPEVRVEMLQSIAALVAATANPAPLSGEDSR